MAAAFHTASLLSIIEQGQKMESLFVRVLLEAAVKLSTITDANIFVMVETGHGRKWAGRRALKDEFLQGKLRNKTDDEEVFFEDEESPATPIVIPQPPSPMASDNGESGTPAFDAAVDTVPATSSLEGGEGGGDSDGGGGGGDGVEEPNRVGTPVDSASFDVKPAQHPHQQQPISIPHPHSSPASIAEVGPAASSYSIVTPSVSPIASHSHPLHPPHLPPHVPNIPTPVGSAAALGFSPVTAPPSLALADRTNVAAPENSGGVCGVSSGYGSGSAMVLPGGAVLPRLQHMGDISSGAKSQKSHKKKKNQSESSQPIQHPHPNQLQHHPHPQHHHNPQFSFPQFVPTIISAPSDSDGHSSSSGAPFKEFLVKPLVDPTADEASQHQQQRLQHFDADSNGGGSSSNTVQPPPPPPLTAHSAAAASSPQRPLVGSQKRKGRPTVGHLLHQKEKLMRTGDGVAEAQLPQPLRPHGSMASLEDALATADDSGIHVEDSFTSAAASAPPLKAIESGEMIAGDASGPLNGNSLKKVAAAGMRLIPIRPKTKSRVHLTFQDENHIETNAFPAIRDAGNNNVNDGSVPADAPAAPSLGGDAGMALELYDPNPLVINEATPPPPETPRRRGVGVSGPPFFCEICNHEFSKPHHLSRHKKEQHTNVQGHPCMFCQHKFKRKEHLRRHVLSRHRTEIPDSEEAQKLFEAPPPTAAQAAAAAAAAAAYSSLNTVVDANGLLLLPQPPHQQQLPPPPPHSIAAMPPQSIALLPPTLAFLPPLSPATNMTTAPRFKRAEDEQEDDDAEVVAPPTASTPSEGPFEGEDGDAYFMEAEGMTGDEEEDVTARGAGQSSVGQAIHHLDRNNGANIIDEEEEEVRLVNDDDDDVERRKENMSVNGREVRAKFFVTNRVPASDLIKN